MRRMKMNMVYFLHRPSRGGVYVLQRVCPAQEQERPLGKGSLEGRQRQGTRDKDARTEGRIGTAYVYVR